MGVGSLNLRDVQEQMHSSRKGSTEEKNDGHQVVCKSSFTRYFDCERKNVALINEGSASGLG